MKQTTADFQAWTDERDDRLAPLLSALSVIDGVIYAEKDDWDSAGVNVFVSLDVKRGHSMRGTDSPLLFPKGIRALKANIRRACKDASVSFNFLHWPTVQRVYNQASQRMERDGYDCSHIKIEVLV